MKNNIKNDLVDYLFSENEWIKKKFYFLFIKGRAIDLFQRTFGVHPKDFNYSHNSFDELDHTVHQVPDCIFKYFNMCIFCAGSGHGYFLCCDGSYGCECQGSPTPITCYSCDGSGKHNENFRIKASQVIHNMWKNNWVNMHIKNGWKVPKIDNTEIPF